MGRRHADGDRVGNTVDHVLGPVADELLSLVADGVICTDDEGTIILLNKAAEEIFGYVADELTGAKVEIIMPQRYRLSHQIQLRKFGSTSSISKRAMARGRDVVGLRKDGTEVPIEASLTRYTLAGRRILTVVFRDISQRRQSEEGRRLILAEMSHRLKNLMTVVDAIVTLTARGAESLESYKEVLRDRLRAVGRTVDLMLPNESSDANLTDLLEAELAPFRTAGRGNVSLSGPEVRVPARWAISLTLVLHELATNAAKYGALSTSSGMVTVAWRIEDGSGGSTLRLEWVERGGPTAQEGASKGFGSDLIARALGRSNTRLNYTPAGLEALIQVNL